MTTTTDALSRQARIFDIAATLAVVLVVLAVLRQAEVVEFGFGLGEAVASSSRSRFLEACDSFLRNLIPLLPTFILIGGIWAARGLFGRVAKGEVFSPANSRAISTIGSSLWGGALAAMIVVPVLNSIVNGDRGPGVHIAPDTLVLVVIGGAITVLGGMMAKVQDENAALQSELGDFV